MAVFLSKMIAGNGNMTVIVDSKVYSITRDHLNYNKLVEAYKNNDADEFVKYADIVEAIKSYVGSGGKVSVVNDEVYYNGKVLHSNLTRRMLDMLRQGFSIEPMIKFLENLMLNPSNRAVEELWDFLEQKGLSISEDGGFLAYKTVLPSYLDKYSRTIYNAPGTVVEVPRNSVDDERAHECSHGLHVGGLAYSGPGGWYNSPTDKVLIVKVMPQDVVSVPKDHNAQKLRCCKYVVVDEFKSELKRAVHSGYTVNDENYDVDDYNDSDYCEDECDETFTLDPWQLRVDDCIEFEYEKEGTSSTRYAEVTEINTVDGYIITNLLTPELDAGEIRRFNFDKMSEIVLM